MSDTTRKLALSEDEARIYGRLHNDGLALTAASDGAEVAVLIAALEELARRRDPFAGLRERLRLPGVGDHVVTGHAADLDAPTILGPTRRREVVEQRLDALLAGLMDELIDLDDLDDTAVQARTIRDLVEALGILDGLDPKPISASDLPGPVIHGDEADRLVRLERAALELRAYVSEEGIDREHFTGRLDGLLPRIERLVTNLPAVR